MAESNGQSKQVTTAIEDQLIKCPHCKSEFLMKDGLSSLAFQGLTEQFAKQEEVNRDEWEKTTMTRLQQELAKKNQTTLKESEKAIEKRVQEAAKKAAEARINEETQSMSHKFQEQQEALQRLEAEKKKAIEEEMKLRKGDRFTFLMEPVIKAPVASTVWVNEAIQTARVVKLVGFLTTIRLFECEMGQCHSVPPPGA